MHITISGHHIEITQALKDYTEAKIGKLEKFSSQITQAQVILSVEKNRHRAEATIHISNGDVFAQTESEDMYATIDNLYDKLNRQLIKHKEKQADNR